MEELPLGKCLNGSDSGIQGTNAPERAPWSTNTVGKRLEDTSENLNNC